MGTKTACKVVHRSFVAATERDGRPIICFILSGGCPTDFIMFLQAEKHIRQKIARSLPGNESSWQIGFLKMFFTNRNSSNGDLMALFWMIQTMQKNRRLRIHDPGPNTRKMTASFIDRSYNHTPFLSGFIEVGSRTVL